MTYEQRIAYYAKKRAAKRRKNRIRLQRIAANKEE